MKNFSLSRYSFILIIPLIILAGSLMLRSASGPFWQYADPCYLYLFDAFRIMKGQPPFNTGHPGTPLQFLIAVVIWVFNLGHSVQEAVNQALINPEFYLGVVYVLLISAAFLTSIILGHSVYRWTNDKLAALLAQLTGLSFLLLPSFNSGKFPVLPVVANVSPETFLVIVINLFNLSLLKFYFSKNEPWKSRSVFLLAIVCGLGFAVKINSFSMVLSALLLVPWRRKLLFMLIFIMSFVFCTLPMASKYSELFHWVSGTVGHSSRYGTGTEKIIDWKSYFLYLHLMLRYYWFFIFSASGLWIWSSLRFISGRQDRNSGFIWALTFCVLLQFAATAKYFSFHYLLPGFGLFSSIFILFYLSQKDRYKLLKPLTVIFIMVFISTCFFYVIPYYQKLMVLSKDIRHFDDKIKANYPESTVIPSTTSDVILFLNKEEALHRADGTFFRSESENLSRLYPDSYYFFSDEVTSPDLNVESYGVWNFKQRVYGDDIENIYPSVIFIKYTSDFSQYPYQVRLLDQSKYLSAFLLLDSTEKAANYLFDRAMDSFKNGNFQQALVLGLKSRQLNYEPRGQLEYFLTVCYQNLLKLTH